KQNIEKPKDKIQKPKEKEPLNRKKETESKEQKQQKLVVFVDFINLEQLFEKYKDEEFRQKVVLNIKTSVKLGFNVPCEFINPHTVVFKIPHTKNFKFLDKVRL